MKQCPRCMRTYTDPNLNFCLDDGELLTQTSSTSAQQFDESPPTVMFDEVRRTNPTAWPDSPPQSSQPPVAQWSQPQGSLTPQFDAFSGQQSPNQTLALVSLGLGIGSITIGWCCSLGLLLAPASLIVGFIALSQIKKDPVKYTGRGLAIGGMATSAAFLAFYVLIMIIWGAAVLFGGVN